MKRLICIALALLMLLLTTASASAETASYLTLQKHRKMLQGLWSPGAHKNVIAISEDDLFIGGDGKIYVLQGDMVWEILFSTEPIRIGLMSGNTVRVCTRVDDSASVEELLITTSWVHDSTEGSGIVFEADHTGRTFRTDGASEFTWSVQGESIVLLFTQTNYDQYGELRFDEDGPYLNFQGNNVYYPGE